jgi:transcriptional regulator with XRE-family HTH domain
VAEDLELVAHGRAIRQVREEQGQSVDALAAALDITSTALLRRVEEHDAAPPSRGGVTVEHSGGEQDRAVSSAFGRRLREVRAAHGLSQDDLARETGVHPTAISRFERGLREPRLKSLLLLARGLGVKPRELVEELGAIEGEA